MLLDPCEPTPIAPITILSLGGSLPPMPKAVEGMICGRINAPVATVADLFRKSLLVDLSNIAINFKLLILVVDIYTFTGVLGIGVSNTMSTGPNSILVGPRSISDFIMASQVTNCPV